MNFIENGAGIGFASFHNPAFISRPDAYVIKKRKAEWSPSDHANRVTKKKRLTTEPEPDVAVPELDVAAPAPVIEHVPSPLGSPGILSEEEDPVCDCFNYGRCLHCFRPRPIISRPILTSQPIPWLPTPQRILLVAQSRLVILYPKLVTQLLTRVLRRKISDDPSPTLSRTSPYLEPVLHGYCRQHMVSLIRVR